MEKLADVSPHIVIDEKSTARMVSAILADIKNKIIKIKNKAFLVD